MEIYHILVCGGREYSNWNKFRDTITSVLEDCPSNATPCIVQGGAKGADFMAKIFAISRGILYLEYPANWKEYGRSAGHIRNQEMLDSNYINIGIVFPGGRGTQDMKNKLVKNNIDIVEVEK